MESRLKKLIKSCMPQPALRFYRSFKGAAAESDILILLHACLVRPFNAARNAFFIKKSAADAANSSDDIRRIFAYDYSLLPNKYLQELEKGSFDKEAAVQKTGYSIGYPAWNLLYYSILCSMPKVRTRKSVIVETGTNLGFSTIILAQALKDSGVEGRVYTVDINEKAVEAARKNVERAGLADLVEFHVEDSLIFLRRLVKDVEFIDFAFLDGNHEYYYVRKEFSIIYSRVAASCGKVYFDNTVSGGVARGLRFIRRAYGGNMLEFRNCSWSPPGNAIWQP